MKQQVVCTNCGYTGVASKENKGNVLIEIILWICFFIPGLIYSIWRRSDKKVICPKCKQSTLVPVDSPVGQKMINGK